MPQRIPAAGLHAEQPDVPCPCADASPSASPPAAEWMPLDELVAQWAALASDPHTASNAIALHVLGDAFMALALEHSAHSEYALATSPLRAQALRACAHDVEECLSELTEASKRWFSVAFWLPRLDGAPDAFLDLVRVVATSTRTQSQRIEHLKQRVLDEQTRRLRGLRSREVPQ